MSTVAIPILDFKFNRENSVGGVDHKDASAVVKGRDQELDRFLRRLVVLWKAGGLTIVTRGGGGVA